MVAGLRCPHRPPPRAACLVVALIAVAVASSVAAQVPREQARADAASATQSAAPDTTDLGAAGWQLKVDAPGPLRDLLMRYLDLARYADQGSRKDEDKAHENNEPLTDQPLTTITQGELARLVAAAPAQARALLETEGYFSAQVQAKLEGGGSTPLTARVTVAPGPLTRADSISIEFSGALSLADDGGDMQARALANRIRHEFPLKPGDPYTQSAWSGAKSAVLTRLRAEAYGLASFIGTNAEVDADQQRAALTLVADSGPLLRIGATRVEGLGRVRLGAVNALQPYQAGAPLREQTLQDFQDRLVKTNLFDSVSVAPAPEQLDDPSKQETSPDARPDAGPDTSAAELTVPVIVRLRERPRQQATVGVGVSDVTGPRVTLEHLYQDAFGTGWTAKSKVQLGQTERSGSVDLLSQPEPGPYRNLVSGAITRTEASGLIVMSHRLRVGRTQDTERVERLYYLQYERDTTRSEATGQAADEASALSANYHWVWRQLDNLILPTQGYGLSAEVGGGRSFHTADDSGFFGRTTARVTGFWPLGEAFFTQARLQLGQVFAAPNTSVPYTQLFRTGGDDSVRGYGNQTLGPVDANGIAIGGRVLGTASVEIARPISRSQPAFWVAAFVDAGNAAANWSQLDPAVGYGVGLRWRSPVGPLRIDLAYGTQVHRARLHFTVGITF